MTFALAVVLGGLAQASRTSDALQHVVGAWAPPVAGRPGGIGAFVVTLGTSRWGRRLSPSAQLERRLVLAGRPWPAETVAGAKIASAGGALLVGVLMALGSPAMFVLAPIGVAVALRGPDLVLARAAKARQARIEDQAPELVELLVATTEAGLGPPVAFRRSAEALGGPLGEELRLAEREIDLGVPWRAAMDHLLDRTEVPSLRRLLGALSRSQRLGTSVRSTLKTVADDLRAERQTRAEEQARTAPVKMLFPLVFLILPAFLLLTVGPVLVATIRSLHSG
jgi:tight adherence protein C